MYDVYFLNTFYCTFLVNENKEEDEVGSEDDVITCVSAAPAAATPTLWYSASSAAAFISFVGLMCIIITIMIIAVTTFESVHIKIITVIIILFTLYTVNLQTFPRMTAPTKASHISAATTTSI